MSEQEIKNIIIKLAEEYNKAEYFYTDPIIFPKHFYKLLCNQDSIQGDPRFPVPENYSVCLQDIEIAAVIAAHLAWGRRDMIVRDITRAMEEMKWKPYEYVMGGRYKSCNESLHRTIKWCEFAAICSNLKKYYTDNNTLEPLLPDEFRTRIFGQKSDKNAANKKIQMLRRWMVRDDGIVDMGIWKSISPSDLIIPLDVHVHRTAMELGITKRKSADITTAREITEYLKKIFPEDPVIGDFALFAYAATAKAEAEKQGSKRRGSKEQKDCQYKTDKKDVQHI